MNLHLLGSTLRIITPAFCLLNFLVAHASEKVAANAVLKIESGIKLEGIPCYRVTTPWAVLYFENHEEASGFKGVFDPEGYDWLQANYGFGYVSKWGPTWEWRGFPNATDDNFGHASRPSGSVNRIIKETDEHIILHSENATMAFHYHFFRSHGAIEVLRAETNYCFLWEGTTGGSCEEEDFVVFSDGIKRYLPSRKNLFIDIPDEWVYLGDPKRDHMLLLGKRPDDTLPDENWRDLRNYELISFGRGNGHNEPPWGPRVLTGTDNFFVYTFIPRETSHAEITKVITALFENPFEAHPNN